MWPPYFPLHYLFLLGVLSFHYRQKAKAVQKIAFNLSYPHFLLFHILGLTLAINYDMLWITLVEVVYI